MKNDKKPFIFQPYVPYRVCFVSMSSNPGSMPGGGARGQKLGHLSFGSKFWFNFSAGV